MTTSPDDPIYSSIPDEEKRLRTIRDNLADRVRMIARCRLTPVHPPLHPTERLWLREGLPCRGMVPLLTDLEWDALVRVLLSVTDEDDTRRIWAEWEKMQLRNARAA